MDIRLQFAHGLEGSPQGVKARLFAEHFDALTPEMDTRDFEACVQIHSAALREFKPDLLVGSSYGAGIAIELLQRGLWRGPTLLLAQAAVRMGKPLELPRGVPVWIAHGSADALIDIEDSRQLAKVGRTEDVRLIEVADDHSLSASVHNGELVRWVRELAAVSQR